MVFVLSKQKKPMDNCTPAKARLLLRDGLATIHKQYPFTIRLKDNAAHTANKTYQIKLTRALKRLVSPSWTAKPMRFSSPKYSTVANALSLCCRRGRRHDAIVAVAKRVIASLNGETATKRKALNSAPIRKGRKDGYRRPFCRLNETSCSSSKRCKNSAIFKQRQWHPSSSTCRKWQMPLFQA